MTKVLLTRPLDDSQSLAAALAERGWEPLVEPMMEIVWLDGPLPDTTNVQALLFTSANGVRAFTRRTLDRSLPVLAVGNATAAAARAAGFIDVASAAGDVDALARLAADRCRPAAGALLHVAGTVTAGDLAGRLTAEGFTVTRAVLYEARTAASLSGEVATALEAGQIAAVLFFSPRTARTFVRLLRDAGLTEHCRTVTVLCLSTAVAEAARTPVPTPLPDLSSGDAYVWRNVRVAERPDTDSLLAVLEDLRAS